MALTKISGSILKDPLNLGGVSIGGTLTYQDVTNVDSVGLGTFRSGINVSGGQLDVGSNVKIGNSGVATATNFKTGSSNLHSTGLTVGNNFLHSTGINVGTGATIHVPATNTLTLGTNSAERLRINSGGKILIGHTSARGVGGSQFRQLQIEGTAGESAISIVRNSANTSGAGINLGKSRSSSVGGSTIVQDDDKLGVISFSGADGVDLQAIAAQITGEVDGTPGENDMPGRIVFKTTADGSSSTTERARITSTGNVGINDTDPSYKLNVIGDNTAHNGIGMLKGIIGVQNDTTAFGSSPTAGISFQTKYRTGPDVPLDVAAIWGGKENPTNGDKDGYMGFATREEGGSGSQERMRITSSGFVGINETSPDARLHISSPASTTCEIRLTANNSGSGSGDRGRINVYSSRNDGTEYQAGYVDIDRSSGTEDKAHLLVALNNGSGVGEKLRISSEGHVTKTANPAFFARPPGNYTLSGDTIVGGTWSTSDSEAFVRGTLTNGTSIWNNSTGIFKVPVTGIYYLHWNVFLKNNTTRRDAMIYLNGTGGGNIIARTEIGEPNGTTGTNKNVSVSAVVSLSVNDEIRFGCLTTGGTKIYQTARPWSYACGYLVG